MEITALKNNYDDLTELEERLMDFLISDCNDCGVTIERDGKDNILTNGDSILEQFDIHNVEMIMFLKDNSVIVKYNQEIIKLIAE
ncbi:hypothetical protein [Clostridium botulinum]|uniref:hypothetical protein n=1 Tax=Clostridium botulinum TaxID=1491 RepID=UPI001C9A4B3B|nr:hypothetical protein [Clostridium botulinum]MBY6838757.1 hypothetical protein [Clostridium botulinum]